MGVQGWTRLLSQEGWLPSHNHPSGCNCCTSLWRNPESMQDSLFASRVHPIPPHSSLHIDGNGLTFYLHAVAYSRHIKAVTAAMNKKSTAGCANLTASALNPAQLRSLLPSLIPLQLLADVTKEFVTALQQKHHLQLTVYFDGPRRRLKQETDDRRQDRFPAEWSLLHQYCLYGVLPKSETICAWQELFPRNRLVKAQMTHTLQSAGCTIVKCQEEADAVMAAAVTGHPQAYIVGNDSDFCFFPDAQYIPVSTLEATGSVVSAVVITREDLAIALNLPDSESMVEVAIAMGNDYVTDPSKAALDCPSATSGHSKKGGSSNNVSEILEYIRARGAGYRIESTDEEKREVLRFIRALYNLQDLSDFPFDDELVDESALMDADEAGDDIVQPRKVAPGGYRPAIPDEMDLELTKLRPMMDFSVRDAVVRCLQGYVDQAMINEDSHTNMMMQEHVDIFHQMHLQDAAADPVLQDSSWRPLWEDIPAAYLIERAVATAFELNDDSPFLRLTPPVSIFDQQKFHALLRVARDGSGVLSSGPLDKALSIPEVPTPEEEAPLKLPIDDYEDTILETIRKNRVSIIQGETGCGKSTRIPIMILKAPPPDPRLPRVKMFISQPRRIAAKALVERVRSVEPELRDAVALRMGHGVREYESSKTQAWFVTTGYLVRLLVNHPEKFQSMSHLIIDEVHERSVDTDILCLLCRRLLKKNEHIRLVLMSATLAAAMYEAYFGVPEPPIKVGARRFPVTEVYLEDLPEKFALPSKDIKNIQVLVKECNSMRCDKTPSMSYMEKVFSVVANIALVLGRPGSSVLIFVPGMNEIVAITEKVEQLFVPGVRFTCFPIHSDIPFEDQMNVFESSAADEVKIIIATNSAESSVTLPDVDHVICLGLCKQIVYNEASHRQMLLPTWISKASATQRAGRTGRLRPGTVYRMYTRDAFNNHMEDFEPGEMLRIPLDSVILMLKVMLAEGEVTKVLLDCLEPPNIATIDRSFESLYRSHFISTPDDSCEITTLGNFVSALGIDLMLGSLIGLGIQFGVAAEAIQMAAILSFPKTPWIMSNPLIHETKDYNEMTVKSYISKCHFDANLYSEPMAAMNLLWEFDHAKKKTKWCWKHAANFPRLKRLAGTAINLRNRVADFMGIDSELLDVDVPPVHMPHAKITALRVLQVWVLNDTIAYCPPRMLQHGRQEEVPTLVLKCSGGIQVQVEHMKQILHDERHPFTLDGSVKVVQKGSFTVTDQKGFSMSRFTPDFEGRFVSFAIEKNLDLIWYWNEKSVVVLTTMVIAGSDFFLPVSERLTSLCVDESSCTVTAEENLGGSRRGRAERACGRWIILEESGDPHPDRSKVVFQKWIVAASTNSSKKAAKKNSQRIAELADYLGNSTQSMPDLRRGIGCDFSGSLSSTINPKFCLVSRGQCSALSQRDIDDLLGTFRATAKTKETVGAKQAVTFLPAPNQPMYLAGGNKYSVSDAASNTSSWSRPLFDCIPEGARLLSVLASGRRREHMVKVSSTVGDDEGDVEDTEIEIRLDPVQTKLSTRWKREGTDSMVYVAENSVPASALPINATEPIYCCCANTLEVRGGGLRAEGLTILPPGRLFLLLCRITFGIFNHNLKNEELIEISIRWLMHSKVQADPYFKPKNAPQDEWRRRIKMAVSFHEATMDLGEELVCFPDKVKYLQQVFDGVDGHDSETWDAHSNPLTGSNLRKWKYEHKKLRFKPKEPTRSQEEEEPLVALNRDSSLDHTNVLKAQQRLGATVHIKEETKETKRSKTKQNGDQAKSHKQPPIKTGNVVNDPDSLIIEVLTVTQQTSFDADLLDLSRRLFATDLPEGHGVSEHEFPSTNLLALVVRKFRKEIGISKDSSMSIDGPDWKIRRVTASDGKEYFNATFSNKGFPFRRYSGEQYPEWMRQDDPTRPQSNRAPDAMGPNRPYEAMDCLPPGYVGSVAIAVGRVQGSEELLFETVESALRMEAAFWLERQFRIADRHWYQQDLNFMTKRLRKSHTQRAKRKDKRKGKATRATMVEEQD